MGAAADGLAGAANSTRAKGALSNYKWLGRPQLSAPLIFARRSGFGDAGSAKGKPWLFGPIS